MKIFHTVLLFMFIFIFLHYIVKINNKYIVHNAFDIYNIFSFCTAVQVQTLIYNSFALFSLFIFNEINSLKLIMKGFNNVELGNTDLPLRQVAKRAFESVLITIILKAELFACQQSILPK